MANTTKHISIRIPLEIYEAIQREAEQLDRSVSWVIAQRLKGRLHIIPPPELDKPIGREAMTGMVEDARRFIATSKHAPTCKCLICKPPK